MVGRLSDNAFLSRMCPSPDVLMSPPLADAAVTAAGTEEALQLDGALRLAQPSPPAAAAGQLEGCPLGVLPLPGPAAAEAQPTAFLTAGPSPAASMNTQLPALDRQTVLTAAAEPSSAALPAAAAAAEAAIQFGSWPARDSSGDLVDWFPPAQLAAAAAADVITDQPLPSSSSNGNGDGSSRALGSGSAPAATSNDTCWPPPTPAAQLDGSTATACEALPWVPCATDVAAHMAEAPNVLASADGSTSSQRRPVDQDAAAADPDSACKPNTLNLASAAGPGGHSREASGSACVDMERSASMVRHLWIS